jgi:hypothetical protein
MVITKEEKSDREIRLIASRDRLKESTQEIVRSFKDICDDKTKFNKLVDDLLAKSKQYMLYSSQKEQLKIKYRLEKVYARSGKFDNFIDFLFDIYKILYTKLQSPIREIVDLVEYDNIKIEDLSLNSIEEEYMNSKGEHFREYLSKIDVKLGEVKIKFTDSFSEILPENLLFDLKCYIEQEMKNYSTEVVVRRSVICDNENKPLDNDSILGKIKKQVEDSLYTDIEFEIENILTLADVSFSPIEINYLFEKKCFVLDFYRYRKEEPDPFVEKEYFNKVRCGLIKIDDDLKYELIDRISERKNSNELLFENFKGNIAEIVERLTLDNNLLNFTSVLIGDIPIFMLPDENIKGEVRNNSYKDLKDIKKIAMSIDPNQWNRVWNVIGESL